MKARKGKLVGVPRNVVACSATTSTVTAHAKTS
jgi:hypothetical protein